MIVTVIEALDLGIFNIGDHTHYRIQTDTTAALDLSLCSPDALFDFTWSVTGDLCGSDHYPILLSSPDVLSLPRGPHWRLDHADWGLFQQLVIADCQVDEFLDIDSAVEYFHLYSSELISFQSLRSQGLPSADWSSGALMSIDRQ